MLRPNLEALARRDPELVRRIGWPVESDHVVFDDDSGEVQYRLHQRRYRLSLTDEEVARAMPQTAPEGAEIFVFGVGMGELVEAILSSRADLRVVAWERDPWLLRLALGQNDWTTALAAGGLRLLLGSDLVEHAPAAARIAAQGRMAQHPFLANVYQQERKWLQDDRHADAGAGERSHARSHDLPLALLCAGGLFTDDLASALATAGFASYTIDIHRLSKEELDRTVGRLGPALIAAVNYSEGLAEFAAAHRCKLICWEVDPTTSAPPLVAGPTDGAFLFTYRRAQVAELHAAGFANVAYLPLAADTRRRAPVPLTGADRARYGAPVSFVGSSMLPQAAGFRQSFVEGFAECVSLRLVQPASLPSSLPISATGQPVAAAAASALLDEVLAEQRRDDSRYLVPSSLRRLCPDLERQAPERFAALTRDAREIAAAEKRLAIVSRLGRLGIRVWGDEGWAAAQPAGAVYQGPAGHGLELTKIYCASVINIDIGRLYQNDIVTMRVFDVLACGGFVLAEHSPSLAELFDIGTEVDAYSSAEELEAKVVHYLANPDLARAIALRGREAVLARHDIAGRVAHMLEVAGLAGGGRRASSAAAAPQPPPGPTAAK